MTDKTISKIVGKITKVKKRSGDLQKFDKDKIKKAVFKAITAAGEGDGVCSKKIADKVEELLNRRFKKNEIPSVEQIQDIVEESLILENLVETAKAYILYREQRRKIRDVGALFDESTELVDKYLKDLDWQVHENANMTYSLQGLNQYIIGAVAKKYWLNKIYPKEIREAAINEDFHIHDLESISTYCCGWDLHDLLERGFGGVPSKLECRPAKHFRTALGQLVNFFYTVQGESAGAQAVSNFDTLMAPFIRYDNLNYQQTKQAIKEFLYNCMVPTRTGFQTPFINISIDIKPPKSLADHPVMVGGKFQEEKYEEFQEEMDIFNRAFYECMMEGDAKGRPFTFPIPTINITKDFPWEDKSLDPMWEATAKYGINYFANFVQGDMDPSDFRSMCCRLRLDNKELYKRGGGLFGSAPLTGSIGVVTINMPRIGYTSKTKKEFYAKLTGLMDLAKESLEIKRKAIENFMEKGLYPYSKYYLASIKKMRDGYFSNHFSTIGLLGMNEALLNFIGEDIGTKRGKKFALEILQFMRERLITYQLETDNLYNLEATPAEGASFRQAEADKKKYPDIITAGTKQVPYYTNSSQLPVNYTDDLFKALELQDELQSSYTGGTVNHLFLGEQISDIQTVKNLVKKVFEKFRLPYITITPTFSICPTHGYLAGEHFFCPKCVIKQPCEVYTRIVGYLRPVSHFNVGKQQEFKERKTFKIK
ncbi:ribonucleoside triphosphate reductase [Candidatus Parcubacteria bacterium]|nr:ribonucleoside triphosphate reductase [Candidatus Parcubacteria bacterium]